MLKEVQDEMEEDEEDGEAEEDDEDDDEVRLPNYFLWSFIRDAIFNFLQRSIHREGKINLLAT
jgi:hypothetical protein